MTIACLGWGSLIWRPLDLAMRGEWQTDGPSLPIEFARQSRDGRITLVIDRGSPTVTTLWVVLAVEDLDSAIECLAQREGIPVAHQERGIGFWSVDAASEHPESLQVGKWALRQDVTAVVWTALAPKFNDINRKPSELEVVKYLAALEGEKRQSAEEYVRRAPKQIATPYRRAIEETLGWSSQP
jgi:hypothetical protein